MRARTASNAVANLRKSGCRVSVPRSVEEVVSKYSRVDLLAPNQGISLLG